MALRTRTPLARLVLPSPTNHHPVLYLLQLGGPSTWRAVVSEAKMLGLHLPGAGKSQKEGRRGSNKKMELNSEGSGREEKLGPTLTLMCSKPLSWQRGN